MKGFGLLTVLLLLFCQPSKADEIDSLLQLKVPVVFIESSNGELPTCDYVSHPENCDGYSIKNAVAVPGRLFIVLQQDTLYDSDIFEEGVSGMKFRIRGNTSAYADKKPYKIKLQKKADLLCRNDNRYRDKNWVLLAKADLDLLIGYKVSQLVAMPWTPSTCYVNLVLNGKYAGLYQLAESVNRNSNARVDVDESTGFIVERDAYWWNERFVMTSMLSRYHYTIKYPDEDDLTETDSMRIHSRLLAMEQSFKNGTYPEHIDVENFAAWMLAHDILGTSDAGGSNMFLSQHDDTYDTRIQMPVLWDFDTSMRTEGRWASAHTDMVTLFPLLFSSQNPSFVNAYISLWNSIKDDVEEKITDALHTFEDSELGHDVAKSFQLDAMCQGYQNDFGFYTNDAHRWFSTRIKWLDNAIATMEITETNIDILTQETPNASYYNLMGQKVSKGYRGIVIRMGQKYQP